jgi:NADPH:quinone reductase
VKALLSTHSGGPETLVIGERPIPEPGIDEVRVRVVACAVNYPDVLIINDLYQIRPARPFSPGSDVAGHIDAVGAAVSGFRVGERVCGIAPYGGMAEYVVLPAKNCTLIPPNIGFDEAAALPLTYATALHALKDRGNLQCGETLLVMGAAGGTGIAAVELGKALGAQVVAAVSTEQKAALAREHGAHEALIWPAGRIDRSVAKSITDRLKEACGAPGAQVIFDPVGGDYAEAALRAISWSGRYLVIGFPAGIPRIPLNLPLLKGCSIMGVFWGEFLQREPRAHQANMQQLFTLMRSGSIAPVISERLPLQRGGEAISRLAQRRALGKILVTVT